jgi:anti-sigma B factor antagonist
MLEDQGMSATNLAELEEAAASLVGPREGTAGSPLVTSGLARLNVRAIESLLLVDILNSDALFNWEILSDLSAQLHRLIEAGHTHLVLNFSGIRFMSSDVLGILAALQRRAGRAQGRVGLCGLDPMLRQMIQICGMDHFFDFYADASEALRIGMALEDAPTDVGARFRLRPN